ncbi:MAG: MBL fold metallo-hydrolase, partial [Desulfobacteraceae bacterium]
MHPVQIAPGVYDVGVSDWNIRDFHGYSTDLGTTYNAFLVVDEKVALIDSVKKEFSDQLLDNIARIVDPKKIDFVVSNHTEPDHAGSLERVMHRVGEDKPLICSKMGHKNLPKHFSRQWNYRPVENGEELSLGKRTLTFLETRMVHWPDSMFSLLKEDGILFSSDGFGQHYAGPEKFDDEIGERIMAPAKKYFANILLLYAPRHPHDLPRPRSHLAPGPGQDHRRLPALVPAGARKKGRRRLRHHVGEHREDGARDRRRARGRGRDRDPHAARRGAPVGRGDRA